MYDTSPATEHNAITTIQCTTSTPQVHIIIISAAFSLYHLLEYPPNTGSQKKGKKEKSRMSNLVLQTDEHNVAKWFRPTAKTLVTHRAPT